MKYYTPTRLSENIAETPEGFLLCVGVSIARTGEMIYGEGETPLEADDSGRVVISRSEEEVFRPETIASFEGKAITIKHPMDFVDPKNWSDLAKGVIQNVRRGEGDQKDDLIADLLIMDAIAIGLVKRGLREVSCGYEAEYTQTDDGKGTQSKIIGNHLALVEEGRAGGAYAINDHNGKGAHSMPLKKKFGDKFKAIFAKAADEAAKALDEDMPEEKEAKDAASYDELVKMVKDLGEKISSMAKPKDEASPEKEEKKEAAKDDDKKDDKEASEDEDKKDDKEKEAKDDDQVESSIEDRLKKVEMALAKLMEGESEDEDMESEDADEEEESEDDDVEEETMNTGDTAARAEILAPGIKITKDVKVKALKAAFGTKEGKEIIHSLTGGKAPAFDSAEKVGHLFIAASEVLKASRTSELSKSKQTRDSDTDSGAKAAMTPERLNEINAKHYKLN